MASKAKDAGSKFLNNAVNFIKQLPGKAQSFLSQVISKVASWASNMASKAKDAGSKFINGAVSYVKQLPSKIWTHLTNAVSKVATWGTNMVNKAKTGMKNVVTSVTNTLKSLPQKVRDIGKDLVSGLWNGINDKLTWLKNKIKSFTKSVLNSIKSFFGVHSPARSSGGLKTTDWVGEMLDEGLANGLIGGAGAPIKAMRKVTGGVLGAAKDIGGIGMERSLQTRSTPSQAVTAAPAGLGDKLDKILAAIEKGQVIMLDGKTFVGATAPTYDKTLGQRRALAARGAL